MNDKQLIDSDLQHIWHPCSQMKDYEQFKPLVVEKARGSYLMLSDGRRVIDAISSWWCKSLGHNDPRIKQALLEQAEKFEHVILANTTNQTIVELSKQLAALLPPLNKVMYASDGSCMIEAAMKMSVHARVIQGKPQRKQFIALQNAYHGETCAAMSVSDLGIYRDPYQSLLFPVHFIQHIPYVSGTDDPLWHDCSEVWSLIEANLAPLSDTATAVIIEPLIQGAAGMKIYSQDFLRRLRQWCTANDVHLIADEIMTGIGRSGKMLACQHADIVPDFMCLSKGLTAGWLPLSCLLTTDDMYALFYDDYHTGKSFLHSHTHTGNALAAGVALAVLAIMRQDSICQQAQQLGQKMRAAIETIAQSTGQLTHIRSLGAVVAADLISDDNSRRLGYEVYQQAVKLGALLRPLGNTIYWFPPLNMHDDTLQELTTITEQAILSVRK